MFPSRCLLSTALLSGTWRLRHQGRNGVSDLYVIMDLWALKVKQDVALFTWLFNDICSFWPHCDANGKLSARYLGVLCSFYVGDGFDDYAYWDVVNASGFPTELLVPEPLIFCAVPLRKSSR